MPLREYECPNCGVIEILQGLSEKDPERCETCGGPIKRIISKSNFRMRSISGSYNRSNVKQDLCTADSCSPLPKYGED